MPPTPSMSNIISLNKACGGDAGSQPGREVKKENTTQKLKNKTLQ